MIFQKEMLFADTRVFPHKIDRQVNQNDGQDPKRPIIGQDYKTKLPDIP